MKFSVVAVLSAFASVAMSATLKPRDIFSPPVLDPHSGTVWTVGTKRNVTWYVEQCTCASPHPVDVVLSRDTSNPPELITKGSLIALVKGSLIRTTGPGSLGTWSLHKDDPQ